MRAVLICLRKKVKLTADMYARARAIPDNLVEQYYTSGSHNRVRARDIRAIHAELNVRARYRSAIKKMHAGDKNVVRYIIGAMRAIDNALNPQDIINFLHELK